ncbi:MAG: beta-N-acetylhexosaminidase [Bdellovibrionales bacterium]|nr:beta-N-acetylhexosaminidase [Bdellovibrionales bacterium]NQZ18551.1 beta-N-acetylhexosaminidase [Bdellovibrionales bacterium]
MRILIIISTLLFGIIVSANDFTNSTMSVDEIINDMPLEKKVGQLFIFGFTGSSINQSLKNRLNKLYPGSVIVFGRNIKSLSQIKKLNDTAQRISLKNTGVPLLIAVDQEGGKVIRIKTSPSLPSARTLALTDDEGLVQDAGYVTGQLLSTLGFNMNLAPVVDISNASYTDFLGNRSFSHQKEIVNKMSSAFSKGLIDAGVLPTAKHFPGHGGVQTDSHLATPYKQITLTELLFNDLAPYKEMQRHRIPFAIMASHIAYPLIDESKMPATYSSLLLQNVLRTGLGFNGIILTDDIQMSGAKINKMSVGERAIQAVIAGNDVIMVGWNYRVQRTAVRAVIKAVKKGRISEDRLNASLRRILNHKLQFYKKPKKETLKQQLAKIPLKKTYGKIFKQVLKSQAPELSIAGQRVDVYSYSWRFLSTYKKTADSRLNHLKNFKGWKRSKKADTVVFHLSGPSSQKALRKAPSDIKSKMVVVNSSSHLRVQDTGSYKKVINIHSYHPNLGLFTAQHLNAEKKPLRIPTATDKGI